MSGHNGQASTATRQPAPNVAREDFLSDFSLRKLGVVERWCAARGRPRRSCLYCLRLYARYYVASEVR
jgi:hypothetical protein